PATDRVVRIKHADDDACDPPFDDPFGAWDLGTVSHRARLQRREEGRTCQRLVPELGLKERELGVISGSEFASEGLAQHHTFPRNYSPDLRRDTSFFARALPRDRDCPLHERSLPLRRGVVNSHCSMAFVSYQRQTLEIRVRLILRQGAKLG